MATTDAETDSPTTPTRLVLIRHGESQVTVNRVIGGHRTCSGLSPLGRRQTERLHDRVAATGELDGAVLISSEFRRAVETADMLAPAISGADGGAVERLTDAGFGEHDPGPAIDGLRFDDYVERFGRPDWSAGPHVDVFPGGETTAQFQHRVGATLSRTLARHEGRLIAVACHGGVIDTVFRHLLRTAPTGAFDLWSVNTSLTEFQRSAAPEREPRWRLVRYNDAAHLAGLPTSSNAAND